MSRGVATVVDTDDPTLVEVTTHPCDLCGSTESFRVSRDSMEEFRSGNRRLIQQVFPGLTAPQRERLMTGLCNCLFDALREDADEHYDGEHDDCPIDVPHNHPG